MEICHITGTLPSLFRGSLPDQGRLSPKVKTQSDAESDWVETTQPKSIQSIKRAGTCDDSQAASHHLTPTWPKLRVQERPPNY
jgi:hypothetical protein